MVWCLIALLLLSLLLLLLPLQSIGDGAESTSELYDKVRRKEFKKRKVSWPKASISLLEQALLLQQVFSPEVKNSTRTGSLQMFGRGCVRQQSLESSLPKGGRHVPAMLRSRAWHPVKGVTALSPF